MTGTFTNTEYGIIACVTLGFDMARHAHVALRTTVENAYADARAATVFDPAIGFSPPPRVSRLSVVEQCRTHAPVPHAVTRVHAMRSRTDRVTEFPLKTIDVPSKTYE